MFKKQIIIGGTGGQGIILAGIVLGDAAVIEGYHVIQSQNYGPESRGGASRADVIISQEEIYYPKVQNADIFMALSQEAFNRYLRYTGSDSTIIADKSIDIGGTNCKSFRIIEYAYDILKKPIVLNMISIGVLNAVTGLLGEESMKDAIKKNVPAGTFDINFSAYKAGYDLLKSL